MYSRMLNGCILLTMAIVKGVYVGNMGQRQDFNQMKPQMYNDIKECMDPGKNKIMDGVYYQRNNPEVMKNQRAQMINECQAKKVEFERNLDKQVKEATMKVTNEVIRDAEKGYKNNNQVDCVEKMDPASKKCLEENVYKELKNTPIWKITIHGNVGILWYKTYPIKIYISEIMRYNIKYNDKECTTHFKNADMIIRQNAIGEILEVVGKSPSQKEKRECVCAMDTKKPTNTRKFEGETLGCEVGCKPADPIPSGLGSFNYQNQATSFR